MWVKEVENFLFNWNITFMCLKNFLKKSKNKPCHFALFFSAHSQDTDVAGIIIVVVYRRPIVLAFIIVFSIVFLEPF